jgi:hypothetical protein
MMNAMELQGNRFGCRAKAGDAPALQFVIPREVEESLINGI